MEQGISPSGARCATTIPTDTAQMGSHVVPRFIWRAHLSRQDLFPQTGPDGAPAPLSDGTRASTWRLYCYYLLFYYMFLGMYAFWLATESHDC